MRMSRVLLVGAAVAAAAVTTSAFTANNDLSAADNRFIGYGEVTVTGITVDDIHYNRLAADQGIVETIVFDTADAITAADNTATMTLKQGVTTTNYSCVIDGTTTPKTITCTANVSFADFDTVGLTVSH